MSVWDIPLEDPAMGPELSVRSMRVLLTWGAKTVGDVKKLSDEGKLQTMKGLGRKSVKEIQEVLDYYERLDKPADLFDTPEYRAHRLEENLTTIQSLMNDVQNSLMRAALKGCVSTDTRRHMSMKLHDAAEKILQLPTYGD